MGQDSEVGRCFHDELEFRFFVEKVSSSGMFYGKVDVLDRGDLQCTLVFSMASGSNDELVDGLMVRAIRWVEESRARHPLPAGARLASTIPSAQATAAELRWERLAPTHPAVTGAAA